MIKHNVQGGFKEEVFKNIRSDKKLLAEIVQQILVSNFPASIHEDILQAVGIDSGIFQSGPQKRNPEFRTKVLRAYQYKCAICGFDVHMDMNPIALEAAHIKWHNAGGPDDEINGLALCALHHKLFDRGAFTLSNNFEIMVSDRVFGSCGFNEWLMAFHGKKIAPRKEHPICRVWSSAIGMSKKFFSEIIENSDSHIFLTIPSLCLSQNGR